MKSLFVVAFFLLICKALIAQTPTTTLLDKNYVDLQGKPGATIFINATADTLKLAYTFFTWLPYTETRDVLTIAPGKRDSVSLTCNFPQFMEIDNRFEVYNAPGYRLVCTIKSYREKYPELAFDGKLADENTYYQAYHHFLGNYGEEGRAYYNAGNNLTDWNVLPAKADSITRTWLHFLEQYPGSLPEWFKKHEHRRLLFNQYFRMSNALLSKEFYGGHPLKINPDFYSYEKLLNQQDDMLLSDTFLFCWDEYFGHQARIAGLKGVNGGIQMIDSLYHQTDLGDINLMYALGKAYRVDKPAYDSLIGKINFKQPERKRWIDSLVQTKLGAPYIGKKAPVMALTDLTGKPVSISNYTGKMVILNFWAVWCGPCIAEFPFENKLSERYKNQNVMVINVCFDSERDLWLRETKKNGLQMVNLYTDRADYNKLLKQYNLTAPPRSVLLDRKGIVVENYLKRASQLTDADLEKIIKHQ